MSPVENDSNPEASGDAGNSKLQNVTPIPTGASLVSTGLLQVIKIKLMTRVLSYLETLVPVRSGFQAI